jgi:hypothetical protein
MLYIQALLKDCLYGKKMEIIFEDSHVLLEDNRPVQPHDDGDRPVFEQET